MKIGMVGCGDIAHYVATLIRLNRAMSVAAVADPNTERAAAFARRHRIAAWYPTAEALLTDTACDALYVAVPHALHVPIVELAIRNHVPVLCEKPLATNAGDAIHLASLAKQSSLKLGVNQQYRYDTGCYRLVAAAAEGRFGQIDLIRINVPWHRDYDYFARSQWHGRRADAGGGTLITQASHFLDIALQIAAAAGARPSSAQGYAGRRLFVETEIEDLFSGTVQLDSGALISISTSMVAIREEAATIEVYGRCGSARYRAGFFPTVSWQGVHGARARPPVPGVHALARSLEGFRRWVEHEEPFLTPADSVLCLQATVDALYASAENKRIEEIRTPRTNGMA